MLASITKIHEMFHPDVGYIRVINGCHCVYIKKDFT